MTAAETPATDTVVRLIWVDLFGRADITGESDFFALGGDSLLAIRLMAKLRRQLGLRVPLHVLFQDPTLAGFSGAVEQLMASAA